jgi:hypothetical protein
MSTHSPTAGVREQIVHECAAMARYALASGLRLSPLTTSAIEAAVAAPRGTHDDVATLTRVHEQLAKLVHPATPRALLLMGDEHGTAQRFPMLGAVGLVRRLMAAAVVAMVVFIAASLTPYTNGDNTVIQNSTGFPLLVVELFWLSAAAMGASFGLLLKVSRYVAARNYDPKYESAYWIKFFLGVMAGFILVAVLPVHEVQGSSIELAHPALAMIGGFGAEAVYRILTRLVEMVEGVFKGDPKEEAAQRGAVTRAQEETAQTRLALAGQVVALQQALASGASAEEVTTKLGEMVHALVPGSAPVDDAPAVPAGQVALPGIPIVSDAADDAAPAEAENAPAAGGPPGA